MGKKFDELLKKVEADKRERNGELPVEEVEEEPTPIAESAEEPSDEPETPVEPEESEDAPQKSRHAKKKKKGAGVIRALILFVVILAFCSLVAYFLIAGAFDFSGINKSDVRCDVVIPQGASTAQIAEILQQNGLIDQPLIFRLYSKLSHKDNAYQAGTYSLAANMGYQQLSSTIVIGNPRETVTVTIPEGYTIDQIAKLLEDKKVCTKADFYNALNHETYDFSFFDSIPKAEDGGVYEGRIYRLEGYLFPDTYEFYTESSGKTVITKFLSNFDSKVTTTMKSAMQAQKLSLDDVVIMASIAQKEAANTTEMPKVTRVLYNRLVSDYTRLECDSTADYVANLLPNVEGVDIISTAYNTYKRSGLTAGAICNPGLAALEAAIFPSNDELIKQCYYFANDRAGNTYYSKTYAQHEAVCRKYHIGMYA